MMVNMSFKKPTSYCLYAPEEAFKRRILQFNGLQLRNLYTVDDKLTTLFLESCKQFLEYLKTFIKCTTGGVQRNNPNDQSPLPKSSKKEDSRSHAKFIQISASTALT